MCLAVPKQNISTHAKAKKERSSVRPNESAGKTLSTRESETTGARGLPITRPAAAVFSAWPLARHGPGARFALPFTLVVAGRPVAPPRKAHHVACYLSILHPPPQTSKAAAARFGEPGQSRRASLPDVPVPAKATPGACSVWWSSGSALATGPQREEKDRRLVW